MRTTAGDPLFVVAPPLEQFHYPLIHFTCGSISLSTDVLQSWRKTDPRKLTEKKKKKQDGITPSGSAPTARRDDRESGDSNAIAKLPLGDRIAVALLKRLSASYVSSLITITSVAGLRSIIPRRLGTLPNVDLGTV